MTSIAVESLSARRTLERSEEEQLRHLETLTAFDRASKYGMPEGVTQSATWTAYERKLIHDSYWKDTVGDFLAREIQHEKKFKTLWSCTNYHEFLVGSSMGRTLQTAKGRRGKITYLMYTLRKLSGHKGSHSDFIIENSKLPYVDGGVEGAASLKYLVSRRWECFSELISRYLKEDTLFVDLGSGWGRYSTLAASVFPNLDVISAELSDSGRTCTEMITQAFGFRIQTVAFNYLDWGLLVERLSQSRRPNLIVFSNHSIEQVPYLNIRLFEELIGLDKNLRFIHIEPIGWQISNDPAILRSSTPPLRKFEEWGGYNKNLFLIVQNLLRRGLIDVDEVAPNFLATDSNRNAGSLLVFHKKA